MRKIEVGDLCLVIGGYPENLGKVVEVIDRHPVTGCWWVRPSSPMQSNEGVTDKKGSLRDILLLPINPDFTETIHTNMEVTA